MPRLRILSTTDLHATLWPHDYIADRPRPGRGLAVLAGMIAAARAEAAGPCLLFDTGDMLQGTALADEAAGGAIPPPHPVIAAMNALCYDAAALGNHDFNYGLEPLVTALAAARFPVLSANLARRPPEPPFAAPAAMIERPLPGGPPLRVGVTGAAPPQTVQWDRTLLEGRVTAQGIVPAVAREVASLRARGADLVVVLCHSGLGRADAGPACEDAARAVAALPGVDLVLAGHSHRRHPVDAPAVLDPGAAPVVMAGAFGSHLGVVDLELRRDPRGGWRIAEVAAALRPAGPEQPADPDILALTRAAHEATRASVDRPVGETRDRLHAVFPLAAHAPALQFLAEAQLWRARQLVAGTPLAALPMVSAVASFAAGGDGGPEAFVDIPPGPLRRRHLLQLSPFPNRLCVLEVSGRTLRAWLEQASRVFPRVAPGAHDAALADPALPGYLFDVIFGVSYRIDLSRAPGAGRIVDLRRDGRPVGDTDRLAAVTNSYRAAGGGGFEMIAPEALAARDTESLADALAAHARARGPVRLVPAPAFGFAPLGGSVVVEGPPQACLATHGDPRLRMEPLPPAPSGFSRFRLHL